jgi:hypothetical protein
MDQDDGLTRQQWLAAIDRIKDLTSPAISIRPMMIPREYIQHASDPNNQTNLRFTLMDQGDELDQ